MHFNKNQKKNHPLEKEVYYQFIVAPFSECFDQTFLDIWV